MWTFCTKCSVHHIDPNRGSNGIFSEYKLETLPRKKKLFTMSCALSSTKQATPSLYNTENGTVVLRMIPLLRLAELFTRCSIV